MNSRWVLLPSGRLAAVSIFPVMMNKISLKNNNNTQFHWTVVNKLNKHCTWRTVNDATVTNVLTLMSWTVFTKQNSKYIYLFSTLSQTDTLSVVQVHPPSSSTVLCSSGLLASMLATVLASLHSWCETFRVSSRWTHLDSVDRSRQLLRTHVTKLSPENFHDLFLLFDAKDTNLCSFCQCCCAASEVAPACSSRVCCTVKRPCPRGATKLSSDRNWRPFPVKAASPSLFTSTAVLIWSNSHNYTCK